MDTKEILSLRQAISQSKESSKGRIRYSAGVKSSVMNLLKSGIKASELCRATGLHPATIANWKKGKGAFRKVRVQKDKSREPETQESTLKVILPNGVQIEGASLSVLRKLFGWFE